MNSRPVKRIEDVSRLRTAQYTEDAGPMAHPIRPESYIKMDNFYTLTVYEKGAEVVRIYRNLLGKQGFRRVPLLSSLQLVFVSLPADLHPALSCSVSCKRLATTFACK